MGTIRKIKDEYYIEFFARGLKYQQRAGTDKTYAQKLLSDIESKIAQGEMGTIVRDVDADIFFGDFLEYAQGRFGKKTFQRYKAAVGHFEKFFFERKSAQKKLSGVTPSVLEDYRAQLLKIQKAKGLKPHTVNLTLILLRDVLEYSRKLGYLNDNPMLHIKLVSDVPRRRLLSESDWQKFLVNVPPEHLFIVEFIMCTGIKAAELKDLRWSDLDRQNLRLRVGDREVPLSALLQNSLEKYRGHSAEEMFLFPAVKKDKNFIRNFERVLSEAGRRAGLSVAITPLTLRQSFAEFYLKKNPSLIGLCRALGYGDIGRAMRYARYLRHFGDEAHPAA